MVDSSGWAKFTSEEGRLFGADAGNTEGTRLRQRQSAMVHTPLTCSLCVRTQTRFLIGWVDYDPSFNFNRQAELEANRDNFVKGIKATLVDQLDLR